MDIFSHITVTAIDGVMTIPVLRGHRTLMKERIGYGLSFCERGRITYLHGGREYVSEPGTAILLPQGETYLLRCDEGGRFPLINFHAAAPIAEGFVTVPLRRPQVFLRDYRELANAFLLHGSHAGAMSVFYSILQHLAAEADAAGEGILRPALLCLEENYADPTLNNTRLAEAAHISEVYLRRLFSETYGVTPHRYLLDLRIKMARGMLASGQGGVTQVAERCGFGSVYHFCRAFRTATGMTPSEYMRAYANTRL